MADDDDKPPPWHLPGAKQVVPPGRRLSKPDDRRSTQWSASGVQGIRAPGKQKPGEGAAYAWMTRKDKKKKRKAPPARRPEAQGAPDAGRPTAGFVPNVFADTGDPDSLKAFLDQIAGWFREHKPDESALTHLAELIGQSHAPYEIIVAFTALSAIIGGETELRNRYAWALERGAKAFYNLAMRLDKRVRPPRGLSPQRMDPIFYDLPATAYQLPYAYATDAFLRMLELVRGGIGHDRQMLRFARDLHQRFIEQRAYGDRALGDIFPWEEPPWAPEDDD